MVKKAARKLTAKVKAVGKLLVSNRVRTPKTRRGAHIRDIATVVFVMGGYLVTKRDGNWSMTDVPVVVGIAGGLLGLAKATAAKDIPATPDELSPPTEPST